MPKSSRMTDHILSAALGSQEIIDHACQYIFVKVHR